MGNLKIISTIKLDYTADEWELYDVYGRDCAAREINKRIEATLNAHPDPEQRTIAERVCLGVLDDWKLYGATDTEGRATLRFIFDKFYRQSEE
jgi:hypothetical protein